MIRVAFRVGSVGLLGIVLGACPGPNTGRDPEGNGYQEYECPSPIGKIVREDCSRTALRYEGTSFSASVGAAGVGASGTYKETAVREADGLVAMLKEQRVGLCNDFNTCKLKVAEYRTETKRIDDSFIALLALKDRMVAADAEQAATLLREIQSIREGRKPEAPRPPDAASPAPPPSASFTDGDLLKATGPDVFVLERGQRRHVPNPAVFDAMGFDWGKVKTVKDAELQAISAGTPLGQFPDRALLKGAGPDVFLVVSGQRRHVPDPSTFNAMGLDWKKVRTISDKELSLVPLGEPLPRR